MKNNKSFNNDLSKVMSNALRHQPSLFDLKLDRDGWSQIDRLIKGLIIYDNKFKDLTRLDIEEMILYSKKIRHEINGEKIRALYGHSLKNKISKEISIPPNYLFHATKQENYEEILRKGLLPMGRQYVHLTEIMEDAIQVALRKTSSPLLLRINAIAAYKSGINFYSEQNKMWLADDISSEYIEKP